MTHRAVVLGCGGSSGVPALGGAAGRGAASVAARPRASSSASAAVAASLSPPAHADHVGGIDEGRSLTRRAGRPLDAYAFAETLDELRDRFSYAFGPWTPPMFYRPVLVPRAVSPGDRFDLLGAEVAIFSQIHSRIRTLGFRSDWFAYSTDVSDLDRTALDALACVDTWVIDCFQREKHGGHAHLAQVLDWVSTLRPRRTLLTHMGPDLDWAWMERHLPAGVEAAYDGMVIERPTSR